MSRKRSRWSRYLRFLKRCCPAPALAVTALCFGVCSSRSAISSASAQDTTASATAPSTATPMGDDSSREWTPRLLPTELHLAPELRSACAPFTTLPLSLMLDETDDVADVLEPMAACLTLGPLSGEQLHLAGSTELPGRWTAPVHGSGRADQVRSSLSLLGVPFESLVTYDVDHGKHVEVGVAPGLELKPRLELQHRALALE